MGSVSNHVEPSYMAAQILSKTNYGIGIYAHILRSYYPNQTVLSLSGRACLPTQNPFNADKPTLNIYIKKENVLGNAMDKEFARHSDSENAIPAGDPFNFAELHYKQSGDELLQTLNKEMNLHIGEKFDFYTNRNKIDYPQQALETPHSPPSTWRGVRGEVFLIFQSSNQEYNTTQDGFISADLQCNHR